MAFPVAVPAQENHGQSILVAGGASAAGRIALRQPGVMERAAAHLAGRAVRAVQFVIADHATGRRRGLERRR